MHKIFFSLVLLLSSSTTWAADARDYLAERRALAASEGYNPYGLMVVHKALMDEHYKLGADPKTTVAQINEPLQKLLEMYPLGIQANQAVAGFLEYLVKQSNGDSDKEAKDLLEIAKDKRAKADAILASILSTGNGETAETAFEVINIIEEYAVLEHFKLEKVSQSLVVGKNKTYDLLTVKTEDGIEKSIFFDISLFYGKRPAKKKPATK